MASGPKEIQPRNLSLSIAVAPSVAIHSVRVLALRSISYSGHRHQGIVGLDPHHFLKKRPVDIGLGELSRNPQVTVNEATEVEVDQVLSQLVLGLPSSRHPILGLLLSLFLLPEGLVTGVLSLFLEELGTLELSGKRLKELCELLEL
ncbi:hypothetical protein TorRG33x02_331740 [Trema orientale]|uniref:Uncharacterized protein n=1 Tax=Trema orientale TaxID=63057 RepID=A0A2P5B5S5_TREOI|nr:hypothetical protein TorRG33x02_331740 [Trema orientale]